MSFAKVVGSNTEVKILNNPQPKKEYKLDIMHKNLFESLRKNRMERKNQLFQDWLDIYIEQDDLLIRDVIANVNKQIIEKTYRNGFKLRKEFKDEVASYIYRQSRRKTMSNLYDLP